MKKRGFTLMEMLIAVAIIAVVASQTIVVVSKIKRLMYDRTCAQKFVDFHQALTLYRIDWGNAHEVVGNAAFMGLPKDPNSALSFRGHDKGLTYNLSWNECPASVRGYEGQIYTYTPQVEEPVFPRYQTSFLDASIILKGETPVIADIWRNDIDHNYQSPRVNHKVIYLNISGNLKTEIINGISLNEMPNHFLDAWVRLKAPDEYFQLKKNKFKGGK